MQTKLLHYRGSQIALVLYDPKQSRDQQHRVGLMTLYEGTGCWTLEDIRLSQYRTPGPYFGQAADDFHAVAYPKSTAEADFIRSRLRRYDEGDDGSIGWCTFDGIVEGPLQAKDMEPTWLSSHCGYFRRAEALAKLKEMQAFWDGFTGDPKTVRLPNPSRQPNATAMFFAWRLDQQPSVST